MNKNKKMIDWFKGQICVIKLQNNKKNLMR